MVSDMDKKERFQQENHPTKRSLRTGRDKITGIGRYPVKRQFGIFVPVPSKHINEYGRISFAELSRFKV